MLGTTQHTCSSPPNKQWRASCLATRLPHCGADQARPTNFSRAGGFSGTTTLAIAGVALAAEAGAQQPQSVTTLHNASATDPGPENETLRALNPNSFMPPPTDHGLPQIFWSSFSGMRRHIQEGGWSRQVNVHDFPISKDIAGVNMRLTAGGIRELHWHKANEWALMLTVIAG